MNIVIVRDLKLGKIYKELNTKLFGRLIEKCLIINTEHFSQTPYYQLQFITNPKEKIYVAKEWNDRFIEVPDNDNGIPETIIFDKETTYNKTEKVYYSTPLQKYLFVTIKKSQYQ